MATSSELARLVITVDRESLRWIKALRAALVFLVGALLILANSDVRAVLPFGVGALFAAIADRGGPLRARMPAIIGASIAFTITCEIAGLASTNTPAHIIVATVVALIAGFAAAGGVTWMTSGVLALVVYTIFSGAPVPLLTAELNTLWIGIGASVQILATIISGAIVRTRDPLPPSADSAIPWIDRLRTHLAWRDQFLLHGVRLAATIGIATMLSEELTFPHSYWIPMTVAWIARPDRDGTVEKVVLRVAGTIIGVAIAGTVLVIFEPDEWLSLVIAAVAMFVVLSFLVANYAVAVIGITTFVFFMFDIEGLSIEQSIPGRIASTLIAAVLVLLASRVGPRPRSRGIG